MIMDNTPQLLIVNVGSTSTKVALFHGMEPVIQETITYSSDELSGYADLHDQLPRRRDDLHQFVAKNNIALTDIDLFISRGGLGKPGPAGAYAIDESMCQDLLDGKYGRHPSALGPAMMLHFAGQYGRQAIIVDPPSTDEFDPLSRTRRQRRGAQPAPLAGPTRICGWSSPIWAGESRSAPTERDAWWIAPTV
jgi:butyrate kinase